MELNTRCPDCETLFPVSLAQLQLRKGYIRCVQCAHIFDGFEAAVPLAAPRESQGAVPREPVVEHRVPEPSAGAADPAPEDKPAHQPFIIPPPDRARVEGPQPARPFSIGPGRVPGAGPAVSHGPSITSAPLAAGEHSIPDAPGGTPSGQEHEPRLPAVLRQRGDSRGLPGGGPSFTISEPGSRRAAPRSEPVAPQEDTDPALVIEPRSTRRSGRHEPEFMSRNPHRASWLTPVWLILILCGLVLLAAQGAYVYRLQLASAFPALRPVLENACARLGCTVPYERRIEAIAITGSALRSSSPPEGEVSRLVLDVTLRNALERPQEWPTLVLDLKDASGTVVVRRNLGPETWVPAELRGGPFAAGSELKVQLPVAVRGLQANGYQLDKFFP